MGSRFFSSLFPAERARRWSAKTRQLARGVAMNATWSKLATAVLLAFVLAPAWAADVPVSYTVDDAALKAAISGTPLTFTLYTDAACTSSVHTQVVNSENVTIISKLKRFRLTGAVKPPMTDELLTTLTGVTPSAP